MIQGNTHTDIESDEKDTVGMVSGILMRFVKIDSGIHTDSMEIA
jgi:hypothetical protein